MSTNELMQQEEGTDTPLWAAEPKKKNPRPVVLEWDKKETILENSDICSYASEMLQKAQSYIPCWVQFLSCMMSVTHMKTKISQTINRPQKTA